MRRVRTAWVVLVVSTVGCASAPGAVGSAIFASATALTASGLSRASGGCYASCPVGTTCNGSTGLCDRLACGGRCAFGEICVNPGWFNEHCEAGKQVPLQTVRNGGSSTGWP